MRYKTNGWTFALGFVASALAADLAQASPLYSDGAINGTQFGIDITGTAAVEDSFTLSGLSTLTSVTFGNWISPSGDTATTVDWAIVGSEGSLTPVCATCSGTASLSGTKLSTVTSGGFSADIYDQMFSLPSIVLAGGTYWLELTNEIILTSAGSPDLTGEGDWDVNGGPSMVWDNSANSIFNSNGDDNGANCETNYGGGVGGSCANSFTINGTIAATTSVPEPGPLTLFFPALLSLAFFYRRKPVVGS